MATPTTVNTLADAAIVAIEASDWATAETKLIAAGAALATIPDMEVFDSAVKYDRQAIDRLLTTVQGKRGAALGFQRQRFEKVRTTG